MICVDLAVFIRNEGHRGKLSHSNCLDPIIGDCSTYVACKFFTARVKEGVAIVCINVADVSALWVVLNFDAPCQSKRLP